MRVLIVEDNEELRNFLCLCLGEANIETVGVAGTSGADELARHVEDENFDVIAIDSVLGKDDGIALAQRIRVGDKGRAIPIILMSEIGTGLARRMASSAGCNEFLVKPFSLSRFVETLYKVA